MIVAVLLLVCLVLAGAVAVLVSTLRRVEARLASLEAGPSPLVEEVAQQPSRHHGADGFETGAGAPSSTNGGAGAPSSTNGGAGAPSSTNGGAGAPSSTNGAASAPSSTGGDVETSEFVITRLGDEADEEPVPTLEARLFADVVLRETVVKAASWTYAVRRSLSPANRNRIWFEMRREVKRARKERKAEEREAIREYRARRRADVREPVREPVQGESAA